MLSSREMRENGGDQVGEKGRQAEDWMETRPPPQVPPIGVGQSCPLAPDLLPWSPPLRGRLLSRCCLLASGHHISLGDPGEDKLGSGAA